MYTYTYIFLYRYIFKHLTFYCTYHHIYSYRFLSLGDDEEVNDDGETAAEAAASVARQARMAKAVELKAAKVYICIYMYIYNIYIHILM
jgi:hypothetical protein